MKKSRRIFGNVNFEEKVAAFKLEFNFSKNLELTIKKPQIFRPLI